MSSSTGLPLGRYLSSTDKKTRDKAIINLSTFLSESDDALPKPEMDKLWKGIFYCFWMSDKPLVQQALATDLAELQLAITSTTASFAFLRGFWDCTVREWNGIDRLRIDKYYMLIRRFMNATFRLLIRAKWDEDACRVYHSILTREGGPLCPNNIRVPASLAYHIADVYVEELNKALGSTADTAPPAPLAILFRPFFVLAAQTPTSTTFKRIQSSVLEPLISALEPDAAAGGEDDLPKTRHRRLEEETSYVHLIRNACFENPAEGRVDGPELKRKLLRQIFEVASQSGTRDSNRRKMYALWKNNSDDNEEE